METSEILNFDLPKNKSSIIKVIGVGGGGGNAVNYMYSLGIKGVDYAICNTDRQHLENSPVPIKLQLGANITEGLGAGANPSVGRAAAEESRAEIEKLLAQDTKMVFITAGMGGGTGTGAAPVIAEIARALGILTVGIVTTPFGFEGRLRLQQAEAGIAEMKKHTDSLIIINNNKLREIFGNLYWKDGFAKADEVVATAARSIAEVITRNFNINIDLRDVKTVLSNSGTAIMGSGRASGTDRASKAVKLALDSPLLNDNHIHGATNVLLLINGSSDVTIDEIGEINDYIQDQAGGNANIIMGLGEDESLGQEISVTVIATGFNRDNTRLITEEPEKKVHFLTTDEVQSPAPKPAEKTPLPTKAQESTPKVIQPSLLDIEETSDKKLENEKQEIPSNTLEQVKPQNPTVKEIKISENSDEEIRFTLEDENEEIQITYITDNDESAQVVEFDFEKPLNEIFSSNTQEVATQTPVEEKITATYDSGVKVFELMDEEEKQVQKVAAQFESEDETLEFEIKVKNEVPSLPKKSNKKEVTEEEDFFDKPIEYALNNLSKSRRENLRKYNHIFRNKKHQIDEMHAEPAYKRRGINIEKELYSKKNSESRFTVSGKGNNTELRTNNSFLHDNVD
ncbi:cell division protein FtsZ [Thermaurantimonas aggregans]|uniref:Cell division protein FtsZ n=1 Tax=Thermaurantimonas aggregans TaxID=2173829 RepID=A0A401XLP0_9FLAO|nr:cell division protein FtsZ [Thermaurantimonas aggregans]MCX8147827.1 cell division protein FtsZ [Thermaurantimonas aggregans]GCD77923.1 cell division protein FtsZ [Thermaurantimonas aggregans]